MKKNFGLLVIVVIAAFCFGTTPAIADEGIGEYASDAGKIGKDNLLPPGQFGHMAQRFDELLNTGAGLGGGRQLMAASLADGINDPSKADEYTDFDIIDLRSATDYCKGTVPGAKNITLANIAKPESHASLRNANKPILLVCATGHQATAAMVVLNALGYDAYVLRFGMAGWRASSAVNTWSPKFTQTLFGPGNDELKKTGIPGVSDFPKLPTPSCTK